MLAMPTAEIVGVDILIGSIFEKKLTAQHRRGRIVLSLLHG
jgi:hypothetical protein